MSFKHIAGRLGRFVLVVLAGLSVDSTMAQSGNYNGFMWQLTGSGVEITGYSNPNGSLVIPSTIPYESYNETVTAIGSGAFQNGIDLTGITIPSSVLSIGASAFMGCTKLGNFTMPASLKSIGGNAFNNCSSLTTVAIPNSVTNIGGQSFFDCTSLTSVTIPNSVTTIGGSAFENSGLTSVSLPASVTNLGESVFNSCGGLETITVDTNNSSYSSTNGVLFDKNKTTLIEFPPGAGGNYTIPFGTTNIIAFAFTGCKLVNITIPASVVTIGQRAFQTSDLTCVVIPGSVTNIGQGAFSFCYSLTNAVISRGITSLAPGAFQYCDELVSVTIAATVTNIGENAFYACSSLTNVLFPGNSPSSDSTAFSGDPTTAYYLPNTTGWSNFSTNTGIPAVLWSPVMQVDSPGFGSQYNGFAFTISNGSTTNVPIVVEACTNLANPVWIPLLTGTLTNGFEFIDPQWTNYPTRFYSLGFP